MTLDNEKYRRRQIKKNMKMYFEKLGVFCQVKFMEDISQLTSQYQEPDLIYAIDTIDDQVISSYETFEKLTRTFPDSLCVWLSTNNGPDFHFVIQQEGVFNIKWMSQTYNQFYMRLLGLMCCQVGRLFYNWICKPRFL